VPSQCLGARAAAQQEPAHWVDAAQRAHTEQEFALSLLSRRTLLKATGGLRGALGAAGAVHEDAGPEDARRGDDMVCQPTQRQR